jgi:hypothetical protein
MKSLRAPVGRMRAHDSREPLTVTEQRHILAAGRRARLGLMMMMILQSLSE